MNSRKATPELDMKAIRFVIVEQLKENHPGFNGLPRKRKRDIAAAACKATKKAMKSNELSVPQLSQAQRLGLEELPKGMMTLDEMNRALDSHHKSRFPFPTPSRRHVIHNALLRTMEDLLDDSFLDYLLVPRGLTPSKRDWMPSQLLRVELLRLALFPEWSVRKYCEYLSQREHKEERAFCHLSLVQTGTPDHTYLSRFRSSLTFATRINLMVYMMAHFLAGGRLGEKVIHTLDSTDVAVPVNNKPLVKLEIPGIGTIRLYANLDCDCGKRRNKRDKSAQFVGYRVHTLCVIDVHSGYAFPLLSLAVAANHHDSQVLEVMLELARAIGLDLKVLTVDEAYADAEKQETLRREQGLLVVTTPQAKAKVPQEVEPDSGRVFCHGACEQPMRWGGYDQEDGGHVFTCSDDDGGCPFQAVCPKERSLPLDTGLFGPVPCTSPMARKVQGTRKVAERPFNLLKHMDGMEPCRMKTKETFSAQLVFAQMIGLFKVMAVLRAQPTKKAGRVVQGDLKFAA